MKLISQMVHFKPPKTIKFVNERSNLKEEIPKDVLIVADLNSQGIERFFKQVYDKKIFNTPHRWLIFEDPTTKAVTVPAQLVNFDILLNSDIIIARRMANESFDMYMIYKRKAKGDWLIEHYGSWTREFRLQKSKRMELVIPLRRRDLALQRVPATFNINDNFTGYDIKNPDPIILNSRHSVTRWAFYLLDIYDFLNATRVTVFSNHWGYVINGTMNGIVGTLARGEAEFGGTPVFITQERMVYCHYLVNPAKTTLQFVFRGPPLSYENNLFVLPFTGGVWCVLSVFVVFMTVVIYVNARWERKKLEILDYDKEKIIAWNLNLSDVTLMVIGAVSQQGTYTELRGPIGRAVTFILLLAFLFLFTAYSANIVALLQSTSKQIRTLQDLLNSKLELGAENTAYNIHFFTTATEPTRKAIYEQKIAPRGVKPKFMPVEEGVQRMQKV
ncbi:uncharacterized protein LOC126369101 [Pectinophora gossypiella]|uniref:uncharacterized protein LOC126369101 n=1 Tax=Pectinophora gossypiella TaxID=13191 RepID=UPI00214F09BE|nr:uncharacterized protein LOC126369101 [Pectinophora gossypiella]